MKSNLSALFDNAKKVTLVSVPKEPEPENETIEEELIETPNKKFKLEREYRDPTADNAQTVFVGNVPSECTQKELKKLFSQFGIVETVRLRNLIPLNPKRGKRLAFIKKELHPIQKTINAFIRFSDETEARGATSLNGFLYKDHHLRVDMAHEHNEETKHDNKRSIFIGNLPFDANDDDVWNAFGQCGPIESVRLIRDGATSVGKGFGYVLFQDEASVALALRMNGNCKVGKREIRIKTAVKKPKPIKPTVYQKNPRRQNVKVKLRKPRRTDDNDDGVKQGRVEKRPALKLKKEKQKKKKKNSSTKTNNSRKDVIHMKKKS